MCFFVAILLFCATAGHIFTGTSRFRGGDGRDTPQQARPFSQYFLLQAVLKKIKEAQLPR